MLSAIFSFFSLLQKAVLLSVNAQNSSFQVYKFQIVHHTKQIGQYKTNDNQAPPVFEAVSVSNSYVLKFGDWVFMIDTVLDSYLKLYHSPDNKPQEIPMSQYLVGNNKVQFYGYHIQLKILYDLNNDEYIKIQFEPTDTLIHWKNKKEGTFISPHCKIKEVQRSYLFIPKFSFVFSNVYPRVVETPRLSISLVETFYLKNLPFNEQIETIKNKLTNVSSVPSEKIKNFEFKHFFLPQIKDIVPSKRAPK